MTLDKYLTIAECLPKEKERKMTREEVIEHLKSIKSFVDKYDDVAALREAIKSLEQESVLDKIRAEFISLYPKNYAGEPELGGSSCEFSLNKILNIIDKYKEEMEITNMKESNKLTKAELFSASVRCPKCKMAIHMRVSNNHEYAYHCMKCDKDFYSYECSETLSDYSDGYGNYFSSWEITLRNKDDEWYKKNRSILAQICDDYNVFFMGCDDVCEDDDVLIDFGWKESPSEKRIHEFTDEIIKLL